MRSRKQWIRHTWWNFQLLYFFTPPNLKKLCIALGALEWRLWTPRSILHFIALWHTNFLTFRVFQPTVPNLFLVIFHPLTILSVISIPSWADQGRQPQYEKYVRHMLSLHYEALFHFYMFSVKGTNTVGKVLLFLKLSCYINPIFHSKWSLKVILVKGSSQGLTSISHDICVGRTSNSKIVGVSLSGISCSKIRTCQPCRFWWETPNVWTNLPPPDLIEKSPDNRIFNNFNGIELFPGAS